MNSLNKNIAKFLIIFWAIFIIVLVLSIRERKGVIFHQLTSMSIFKNIIRQSEESVVLAKGAALSFDQPSFVYLANVIQKKEKVDPAALEVYEIYFEKARKFYPDVAEIEGVLGALYYYRGDWNKAIWYFENASRLRRNSFWFSYNLGLIYYQAKDFQKAAGYFSLALQSDTGQDLQSIYRSQVYNFIFFPQKQFDGYDVQQNLKHGLAGSYYYWGLSEQALGNEKIGKELIEKAQILLHNISGNNLSFPDVQFF